MKSRTPGGPGFPVDLWMRFVAQAKILEIELV